jgi:hypothetical protein
MVAGVLEETPSIFEASCRQCCRYRFQQSLFAPGCSLAKQVLDLGKRFKGEKKGQGMIPRPQGLVRYLS